MWSALEGSILLWTLILAGYIAAVAVNFRRRVTDPLVGWATLITLRGGGVLLRADGRPANPFRPSRRHAHRRSRARTRCCKTTSLVAFHPPLLYLGFVGFTIPFAFAWPA